MNTESQVDQLHAILEEWSFDSGSHRTNSLIHRVKKFRDAAHASGNSSLTHLAQVELDVLSFRIRNNQLSPLFTSTTAEGLPFAYPSLSTFSEEDYNYLTDRIRATHNSLLKIQYAHVLWLSPKKHLHFATLAADNYRTLVKDLESKAFKESGDVQYIEIFWSALLNYFHLVLAMRSRQQVDDIRRYVLHLLKSKNVKLYGGYFSYQLIEVMLDHPKAFPASDFEKLDKFCLWFAKQQTSLNARIQIYLLAERISDKQKIKDPSWDNRIGDCYEKLSFQREDQMNLVAMDFCQKAIPFYKKAKNSAKVKAMNARYKLLKQHSHLTTFVQELDLSKQAAEIKRITTQLLEKDSEDILDFLTYSPYLFPSFEDLRKQSESMMEGSITQSLFISSVKDEFGHTSAHYSTHEEKLHFAIMQRLDLSIRTISLRFIGEIIGEAVRSNKLSALTVYHYLKKNCWIGQDLQLMYKDSDLRRYNWLETLMPGLNDVFGNLHFHFQDPLHVPSYMLAIDSLVLKIEGIVRDFCDLRGGTTFFHADKNDRQIAKEKDLNALLHDENVVNALSKDDHMLFEFVFIDKAGWNLRNRIAHTLIRSASGYGLAHALLVFVCILRLGKAEYALS